MIKVWLSRLFLATMLVSGLGCLFIRPMTLDLALPIIIVNLLCHSCQAILSWDNHQDDFLFYGGLWSLGALVLTGLVIWHQQMTVALMSDMVGIWTIGIALLRLIKSYQMHEMGKIKENLPLILSGLAFLGIGSVTIFAYPLLAPNINITLGVNLIVAALNHAKLYRQNR